MHEKFPSDFSSLARSVIVGCIYEHYKGSRYKLLAIARHRETLEELVVYQALYGEGDVWVRPVVMFIETIMLNGQARSRFKLVE